MVKLRRRLFGTDGVRGKVYSELSPEMAYKLGIAIAKKLSDLWRSDTNLSPSNCFVIGGDTRVSTPPIMTAISSGLTLAGAEVRWLGIAPTPAIALVSRYLEPDRACWAIAVSASHNPPEYNGIKLMSTGGLKSPEELERSIEDLYYQISDKPTHALIEELNLSSSGSFAPVNSWEEVYLEALRQGELLRDLNGGLEVTLDVAHGATYSLAPLVFKALGYRVHTINSEPDGMMINVNCGATHPSYLRNRMSTDIGFAFDGDGDRVIAVLRGKILDGDDVIYVLTKYMLERGFKGHQVVVTVMTNMGVEMSLRELGVEVLRVPVGDKYVQEKMMMGEALVGGEQSGHIIISGLTLTGDGIATALALMRVIEERGIDEVIAWVSGVRRYPQELINLPLRRMGEWNERENRAVIEELSGELGHRGRIVVRPSGTEPLLRVMIEAETPELLAEFRERVLKALKL